MQSENTEAFIREIRLEKRWKDDGIGRVEEFSEYIKNKFSEWTQILTDLSDQEKYDDQSLVLKEISELRNHLDNIFPKVRISMFI